MQATTVLVAKLTGQAWIRGADGNLTPVQEGMRIAADAQVVTASGSTVQLQADGQPPLTLGENQDVALNQEVFEDIPAAEAAIPAAVDPRLDNLIAAINNGQDPLAELDATAATMVGGGGGGGTYVRLSSVVEHTVPLALAYPRGISEVSEDRRSGAASASNNTDTETTPAILPYNGKVTLNATEQVMEGGKIVVTATVDHPPVGSDLVITLETGEVITIKEGETSGSVEVVTRVDDEYIQGTEHLVFEVGTTTGGGYNNLDTNSKTGTDVVDDDDEFKVSIESNGDVNEAQAAVFTIKTSQALSEDLTVTLKNGDTVVIKAGETSATYTVPAQGDDVFKDPSDVTMGLKDASVGSGKEFEDLQLGPDATVKVSDTVDVTTLTLNNVTVKEGSGTATIGATLDHAPQTRLVVTLSNGASITFGVDYVPGTVVQSTPFAIQSDDAFVDGEVQTIKVVDTAGGNFESLDTSGTATVTVEDTIDTFSVTLQSNGSVIEGQDTTFTITLSQALDEKLILTLSNGTSVEIDAGKTTGTYVLPSGSAQQALDLVGATVPPGKTFEDLVFGGYSALTGGVANDNLTGGNGNDVVIADVQGLQVLPGKNYNIAFIVDTSSSMGEKAVADAVKALKEVITQLITGVKGDNAGTINIYLSDFDSKVQGSVSVNLKSFVDVNGGGKDWSQPDGFPDVLQALLNSMKSSGGTNYETAFKDASNWFYSDAVKGNPGTNLTYFITDGEPTEYYSEVNPIVVNYYSSTDKKSLNQVTLDAKYKPGDVVTLKLGGVDRLIVDADGRVYAWVEQKNGQWVSYLAAYGTFVADGKGGYECTSSQVKSDPFNEALAAFKLLKEVSTGGVEAIGLGPFIDEFILQNFDTDGVVQTNINASDLANAILGRNIFPSGDDIVHGGNGNDILFGDQIRVGELQGFAALQKIVADQLGGGLAADKVTVEQVHDYITKHPADFAALEISDGGKDELHGGSGNDILYGQGGDDTLYGNEGNDILYGGIGSDTLYGGVGNDILVGGKGNDTLIGGDGDDVFVWLKGDQGTVAAPALDVIKDFGNGNDKLDLRDLLQGEDNATDLSKFLHFERDGDNTVLKVSSAGGLAVDGSNFDQKITLEGVQWADPGNSATAQNDLIKQLISQGKLVVDGSH